MEAYGSVNTLSLFGGGANSPLWCQIISDATGMRIQVPETTEAAGAGAAMLAAMAAGEQPKPLRISHSYVPSSYSVAYDEKYHSYRIIEKRLWSQEVQS
jgi:sugar (pentulose or hexulose) kinase